MRTIVMSAIGAALLAGAIGCSNDRGTSMRAPGTPAPMDLSGGMTGEGKGTPPPPSPPPKKSQ